MHISMGKVPPFQMNWKSQGFLISSSFFFANKGDSAVREIWHILASLFPLQHLRAISLRCLLPISRQPPLAALNSAPGLGLA